MLLLLALVGGAGCAAVKSGIHIVDAESALRRADDFDAKDRATYEYVMALNYLEKAREEHGYSEYKTAERMAKKSAEWSDKAIIYIERGGGLDIDTRDLLNVPDQVAPPPVPIEPPPESTAPGTPSDEELFAPAEPVEEPATEPEPEPEEEKGEFEQIGDEEFEWDQ